MTRVQIFMKSKTQPPELIFVVLNFVALDGCTRHTPFAIERKSSSDHHQSDRNREVSSLILHFDSRRHCQQDEDV